ncbi:MAG: hypothetical protein AAGE65_09135 [Planctomycetota bacterium]
MADFTPGQKKIVDRYYANHDTIQSTKLAELVSELWLADDPKAATKLWGKAQVALMRLGVDANKVASVVGAQDVEALARLVKQADTGGALGQQGREANATPKSSPASSHAKPRDFLPSVADGRTIGQMRQERAKASGHDSLEEDNLKKALKAFRRKLKTMRRDDESKLGSKYVTSGRSSQISAIEPPREYPAAVWRKLVELKRLCDAGRGLYELPEDRAKGPGG